MQAIALGLAFTLILIQNPTGLKKSNREQARLVGNVRSTLLEIARLEEKDGKLVEGKRFGTNVTRYDEKGYTTEQVGYLDGKIMHRTVFTYDPDGSFTKKVYTASRPQAGNSQTTGAAQAEVFKVKVKYDPEGNPIEEATHDSNGVLTGITLYKHDKQNNKMEVTEKEADGNVESICVETYGERGQEIEMVCQQFDIQSVVKHKFTYEFDSTGNWTKRYQTATQIKDGKQTELGRDIVYRTISYDASKDVYPDDRSRVVDPLPDRPMVIRLSGGVLQKKATKIVSPVYPRATGVSGSVVVEVRIDVNGKVIKAEVISGPVELRQAAIDAIKQWEFSPMKLSGQAVDMIGNITFNFER